MEKKTSALIDGENIVYHILQKQIIQANDADNPPTEVKYMIEQLLLWGGVWFSPSAYKQIPVLRPHVVRDASCRNSDPSKDAWGEANNHGFLRDDNSCIKNIPYSLKIESAFKSMKGKKLGKGFVASHVWMSMQNRLGHACEWERANSFIPNLVWLPSQLSKLTDRDGSYAQKFIQHISGLLYRSIPLAEKMLSDIWNELPDPGLTPISNINLNDINYFEYDAVWINRGRTKLNNELQLIIDILNGNSPKGTRVTTSKYLPTLAKVSKTMSASDRGYLKKWINANIVVAGASVHNSILSSTKAKGISVGSKKTFATRRVSSSKGSFTTAQVANSVKAYIFDGESFRTIESKYLGMPKLVNGGGWVAKRLLENRGVDSSLKKFFGGKTINEAIAIAKEPLKSTLIWMKANIKI